MSFADAIIVSLARLGGMQLECWNAAQEFFTWLLSNASGKLRFVLIGKDATGTNWTRRACPFLQPMRKSIAKHLAGDVVDRYINARTAAAGIIHTRASPAHLSLF